MSAAVGTRPALRLAIFLVVVGALAAAFVLTRDQPAPYVITAIDYHFHDAHPTQPIEAGRDLVVKNAGRNVHNVTIPALGYSEDVPPGGQLVIEDVAAQFGESGRYPLYCRYHEDRKMKGTIVITAV